MSFHQASSEDKSLVGQTAQGPAQGPAQGRLQDEQFSLLARNPTTFEQYKELLDYVYDVPGQRKRISERQKQSQDLDEHKRKELNVINAMIEIALPNIENMRAVAMSLTPAQREIEEMEQWNCYQRATQGVDPLEYCVENQQDDRSSKRSEFSDETPSQREMEEMEESNCFKSTTQGVDPLENYVENQQDDRFSKRWEFSDEIPTFQSKVENWYVEPTVQNICQFDFKCVLGINPASLIIKSVTSLERKSSGNSVNPYDISNIYKTFHGFESDEDLETFYQKFIAQKQGEERKAFERIYMCSKAISFVKKTDVDQVDSSLQESMMSFYRQMKTVSRTRRDDMDVREVVFQLLSTSLILEELFKRIECEQALRWAENCNFQKPISSMDTCSEHPAKVGTALGKLPKEPKSFPDTCMVKRNEEGPFKDFLKFEYDLHKSSKRQQIDFCESEVENYEIFLEDLCNTFLLEGIVIVHKRLCKDEPKAVDLINKTKLRIFYARLRNARSKNERKTVYADLRQQPEVFDLFLKNEAEVFAAQNPEVMDGVTQTTVRSLIQKSKAEDAKKSLFDSLKLVSKLSHDIYMMVERRNSPVPLGFPGPLLGIPQRSEKMMVEIEIEMKTIKCYGSRTEPVAIVSNSIKRKKRENLEKIVQKLLPKRKCVESDLVKEELSSFQNSTTAQKRVLDLVEKNRQMFRADHNSNQKMAEIVNIEKKLMELVLEAEELEKTRNDTIMIEDSLTVLSLNNRSKMDEHL